MGTSLDAMTADELKALFLTLETPTLAEMDGEYRAQQLAQVSVLKDVVGRRILYGPAYPGHWLGKAFTPTSADRGQGYNSFRWLGKIVRRWPMLTLIAPSRFDRKPAFTLVYRAFHSLFGELHFVDEVRRLSPGVYLGLGTSGFNTKERMTPLPFELRGPSAPYVGHIGKPRAGFDLEKELIP